MNVQNLKRDVVELARPEGRMVGTPGHRRACEWLCARLDEIGAVPYGPEFAMPYRAQGWDLCNAIGVIPGRNRDLAPVVLGAHYDTCGPLPGADDNAAAVAIALAVGEALADQPAERDVIVALFDGEEPPCFLSDAMGSIQFYEYQRREPVHAAVVLDLVGHDLPVPGLRDLVFVLGAESDPALPEVLRGARADGVRVHPALNRYVGDLSDHHVFRVNQRPFLFLSCGRWQHYHMPSDTPDKLNYDKMAAIAVLTQSLVVGTAEASLDGPFMQGDTLDLELSAIRAHFGPVLGPLAPRGRIGVDRFVGTAMTLLGL